MKCYMMILTATVLMNLLPAVLSQTNTGGVIFTDPDARRVASELTNSSTCPIMLMSSLNQLLMPTQDKFNNLCGPSYFVNCKNEFMAKCALTDCASTNEKRTFYEKWVDAFSMTGRSYTCTTIGFNKTVAILTPGTGDGYVCLGSVGLNLLKPIEAIIQMMWTARAFSCSEMSDAMTRIVTPLNNCTNPALKNLITGYLNTVADQTTCKEGISVGQASTTSLNSGVVLFTLIATTIFGYFHL